MIGSSARTCPALQMKRKAPSVSGALEVGTGAVISSELISKFDGTVVSSGYPAAVVVGVVVLVVVEPLVVVVPPDVVVVPPDVLCFLSRPGRLCIPVRIAFHIEVDVE